MQGGFSWDSQESRLAGQESIDTKLEGTAQVSAISQQVGEMCKSMQSLSEQMDRSETRMQTAVSQQVGDIKSSLQRSFEQNKDSRGDTLSPALPPQHIEEIQ